MTAEPRSAIIQREQTLIRRIRFALSLFIAGLVLSGATAIPLRTEIRWMVQMTGAGQLVENDVSAPAPAWARWLTKVEAALEETASRHPFLYYGTDWLAFGHFMIALVFIGALRNPAHNRWLFTFGIIACILVIPYAIVFGAVRGIPFWWRLIDCSFGIIGIVPLALSKKWLTELEKLNSGN